MAQTARKKRDTAGDLQCMDVVGGAGVKTKWWRGSDSFEQENEDRNIQHG